MPCRAVPAAGAWAWEQLCFSCAVARRDSRCPGFCAVPVMPECHQLFSAVLAGGTAGEQAAVVGTAVLVATSPWGEQGRSCRGGWGCRGWICASGRVKPGGFSASPYKAGFCSRGGWQPSPTGCANSRIWPFPAFSPSFQASMSTRVGKVSLGDQLNVYPPLQHGNAESTLIFMPCDILQLPARCPLAPPASPRLPPALAFSMAPLGEAREGTSLLPSYRPARCGQGVLALQRRGWRAGAWGTKQG